MTSPLRIAAVQHDIVWEDPVANRAALGDRVRSAAAQGARLVVLSETFSTGFTMATDRLAEDEGGPTSTWLTDLATDLDVWVMGSIAERAPGHERPHNRLLLTAPDGTVHRYAKIHPFTFADEHHHYEAGTEPLTVEVDGVRVSPLICYDLRFADLFWGLAEQTDVYVVVANWPAVRRHHWRSLLVARAIENQAWVVGVNRVGEGDGIVYAGDSTVLDPLGEAVATAAAVETTLVVDVDPTMVGDVRRRFPFIADRR